jgi:peptide/nickel transport system ATP-binding protein
MDTLLEIKSVSYKPPKNFSVFGYENEEVLKNINLFIERGSITGIAGESGSGKTTLARIIAGIIKPSSGTISLNYTEERKRTSTNPIQILFQNNGEIINPFRRISDTVRETLKIRNSGNVKSGYTAEEILEFVNLGKDTYTKKGYQLSGGEQQRAALARIIAAAPELLILDEPFSAQDPESRINLSDLFTKINREMGITIICISHNLQLLKKLCSRLVIIYKGEITEEGNCGSIFNMPEHPYTKYLLKAEQYNLTYDELKEIPEN